MNYRKTFGDWFVNVGVNGSALRNEVKEVGDPILLQRLRRDMNGTTIPLLRMVMP